MSVIREYLSRTISGMEQFFVADKMVVLLLAVFFFFWLKTKKNVSEKGNKLLVFSLVVSVLLLCPLTAVVGVIYQTAFYDYEWLWSMVPLTIVISYAAVLVYDTKAGQGNWKKKAPLVLVFLLLLFWCGNQGALKTVDAEEAERQEKAGRVLDDIMLKTMIEDSTLWAPKSILQEARRRYDIVNIKVVYGRDMWEAKAGAYDYEAYSDKLVAAYEWMEDAEEIAEDTIPKVVKILWERENMSARLKVVLPDIVSMKVNCIIIPMEVEELFEEVFFTEISEMGMTAEEKLSREYIIYWIK